MMITRNGRIFNPTAHAARDLLGAMNSSIGLFPISMPIRAQSCHKGARSEFDLSGHLDSALPAIDA